jgi:DNA repair exonuclease SbcCD ATPase subunit
MSSEREICKFCKSSVKDKYTLKSHLVKSKKCLQLRGLSLESKFICSGCNHVFPGKANLLTHLDTCKDYIILNIKQECKKEYTSEITKLQEENNRQITKLQEENNRQITKLQEENNRQITKLQEKTEEIVKLQQELSNAKDQNTILQKICDNQTNSDKALSDAQSQIDKLQKIIENIATKAVDKPTTNTTFNQIRNNFSSKYFLENIKAEEVKKKCQTNFTEEILMNGQRGIARLCTDQIINTKDKKKLLVATDQSRNKFRYMDEKGNMKDDIEARTFIEKVSKPIKEVAGIVFDNVLLCIKDEKEMVEEDDYGRKAQLRDKELQANSSMVYINCFDDPKHNSEFMNELAILNKCK